MSKTIPKIDYQENVKEQQWSRFKLIGFILLVVIAIGIYCAINKENFIVYGASYNYPYYGYPYYDYPYYGYYGRVGPNPYYHCRWCNSLNRTDCSTCSNCYYNIDSTGKGYCTAR